MGNVQRVKFSILALNVFHREKYLYWNIKKSSTEIITKHFKVFTVELLTLRMCLLHSVKKFPRNLTVGVEVCSD